MRICLMNVLSWTVFSALTIMYAGSARIAAADTGKAGQGGYCRLAGAYYYRYDSGEAWEKSAKVGPHADVMVRLGDADDKLVFWRGSSYLPFWQTASGKWHLDEVLARKGDGPGLMTDKINQYSHVKIVENSQARAIVQWRYVRDFKNPTLNGWVEEYFTVYPDGACFRGIREGSGTLEHWQDPANTIVKATLLTPEGLSLLPKNRAEPVKLSLNAESAGSYEALGYDRVKGCYDFRRKSSTAAGILRFSFAAAVTNPAVVVKDWGDADAKVTIDGKVFADYRRGYARRMNGDELVLWFNKEFAPNEEVSIEPKGGSPIVRAPIKDPYSYKIPVFPEGSTDPGPFGAYYTHPKYFKEWDQPWRVGEYADIVVQFDRSPDRFIFWRGPGYVPHWANESNFWYNNEFCERRGKDAGLVHLCEVMQDHECRYTTARIIHNHNARTVIHWRYAPCDRNYDHPFVDSTGWGDWVDEYYTVYPDEVCVRKATLYTSAPKKFNEWHEAIPLVNPGLIPEDVMHTEAVAMTDINGNSRLYSWNKGFPKKWQDDLNIMLVRLKGKSMPFVVVESKGVWVDEVSMPDKHRFNHYDDWPGWPASMRGKKWDRNPETGYREFWRVLPSHSSLMHFAWDDYANNLEGPIVWKCKIMLNGMTTVDDVNALIPLTRSWEHPPTLVMESPGFEGGTYDKPERAYRISQKSAQAKELTFKLQGSSDSPVVNPCFIIENWPGDAKAGLEIDGKKIEPGPYFRQGIEKTADGVASLVVWIQKKSTAPVKVTITK